jgi:hypothetical protein
VNLLLMKAPFDQVKYNKEALEFHMHRFENGSRDKLAKACYQHWQYLENRSMYEKYVDPDGNGNSEVIIA